MRNYLALLPLLVGISFAGSANVIKLPSGPNCHAYAGKNATDGKCYIAIHEYNGGKVNMHVDVSAANKGAATALVATNIFDKFCISHPDTAAVKATEIQKALNDAIAASNCT